MPSIPAHEVNDLIGAIHRVAEQLDYDVHDLALDTGLTEVTEALIDLTPRQNLVRLMVRVTHELNSVLGDGDFIPEDRQPCQYGPRDTYWGA